MLWLSLSIVAWFCLVQPSVLDLFFDIYFFFVVSCLVIFKSMK